MKYSRPELAFLWPGPISVSPQKTKRRETWRGARRVLVGAKLDNLRERADAATRRAMQPSAIGALCEAARPPRSELPWTSTVAPLAAGRSTPMYILGEHQLLAPLPDDELQLPAAWFSPNASSRLHGASSTWAPNEAWGRVVEAARASRRLRVAILGTSPTSGCGAGEPWIPQESDGALSSRCSIGRSWGRRFADELDGLLRMPGLRDAFRTTELSFSLAYKNAVAADYFSHCTRSHLSNESDVVLLEVATNIWGSDMPRLVRSVRAAAPRAAIVFAAWTAHNQLRELPKEIHSAAHAAGVDVMHVGEMVNDILARGLLRPYGSLFAKRGADKVHPSAVGHAFLAATMARFVAGRLLKGLCLGHERGGSTASRGEHRSHQRHHETPAAGSEEWETCWERADILPVAGGLNGSWALIDEGKVKGVPKLGLASWSVGEWIDLGPLPGPDAPCAVLIARLGYLVSASREGQGAFRISCLGCWCTAYTSFFQQLFPYPEVQTDALFASDPAFQQSNVSATATTSFIVDWRRHSQCTIRIQHRTASSAAAHRRGRQIPSWREPSRNSSSRIRIDSFNLEAMTIGEFHTHLRRSGGSARAHLHKTLNDSTHGDRTSGAATGQGAPPGQEGSGAPTEAEHREHHHPDHHHEQHGSTHTSPNSRIRSMSSCFWRSEPARL